MRQTGTQVGVQVWEAAQHGWVQRALTVAECLRGDLRGKSYDLFCLYILKQVLSELPG